MREMLRYVSTRSLLFSQAGERNWILISFGRNRNYEQSLGRRNELHSASQASVECSVASARQKGDTKRCKADLLALSKREHEQDKRRHARPLIHFPIFRPQSQWHRH